MEKAENLVNGISPEGGRLILLIYKLSEIRYTHEYAHHHGRRNGAIISWKDIINIGAGKRSGCHTLFC
jgi:hypothetical protein